MKHAFFILTAAFFMMYGTAALAQSDSQIKQNFENRHAELLKAAEAATTTDEIKKVQADIDSFEKEYEPNKAFLDKALYPDDFTKTFEILRSRVNYTAKQTQAVETQTARATEFEGQVRMLTEQVDRLTSENASILDQVHGLEAERTMDKKQIDQLTSLVAKLQKNIADRDNMIFNLADSLFLQFDKPNMSPGQESQRMVAFEKNNILTSVKRAINDNMSFLQSTTLSGEDVVKLKEEQRKFAGHWNGVGPKLAQIYLPSKNKTQQLSLIDSMIVEWKLRADAVFWKALNNEFQKHAIVIKPFNSGEGFYQNVTGYIENQTNNVENQSESNRYAAYTSFADTVWEKRIEPVWQPLLQREGYVTQNQMGDIKAKMEIWKSKVKSSNYVVYFLIAGALLIIGFIYFARTKKGQKPPVPAQTP
jgi:hypothetical protein